MLYKKFFGYALSVAMLYTNHRNDAIEIVDDSFIKVFSEIERFDMSQPFKGWLRKIVINSSIDRLRRNNRVSLLLDTDTLSAQFQSQSQSQSPEVISHLTAKEIITMLNCLPGIHKTVFCLYEIEGYNHEEIARQLSIPISSSRVYLARAKQRLRELYQVYFNSNHKYE
ncbi:MAG: RNA polymerase sigma factor [Rikenellaceae bacterium]